MYKLGKEDIRVWARGLDGSWGGGGTSGGLNLLAIHLEALSGVVSSALKHLVALGQGAPDVSLCVTDSIVLIEVI